MKTNLEELQVFHDKCASHDWYYERSDDHRMWRKGKESYEALSSEASRNIEKFAIFRKWNLYVENKGNVEKPERPK